MRWIVALGLTLAVNVSAATHVELTGATDHGEVCRFQAHERENPFDRWLSANDVTCVDAGSALSFPSGLWNVFARSHGAISENPILVDGARPPQDLSIGLVAAATVVVQLPDGDRGVLYSPKHLIAFPASERTSVPSGEELWLFVLSKSVPVAVIPVAATEAGSERVVDARNVGDAMAVVGWLRLSDEDQEAADTARGLQLPHIHITAAGKESEAMSLPGATSLKSAFVLVPVKSAGEGELRLDGRGWIASRRSLRIEPKPLTVIRGPIVARATTTVIVNWSTGNDLPALDRSLGSCQPSKEPPHFDLTISLCEEPAPGKKFDAASCTAVRKESLRPEATFGTVTVNEVPPGLYTAELRFGKLPPVTITEKVPPLQQRPMSPLQAYYLTAYGSLTRGGAPLGEDARLEFPSAGIGFSLRESGEYHAVLRELAGVDAKIDIITCSGKRAFVVTDREMRRNARFDIDIPDNVLTVTVVDTFTHAGLPAATLQYSVMSARFPRQAVLTREASQTDEEGNGHEEGRFVIKSLPERTLRITVKCRGYKKNELEPFSLTKSEKKEIEVQMEPESGSVAKIISGHPFENGTIFWFSVDGAETERVDLAADGTFHYEQTHYRDETMTVVSLSHPLWILRAQTATRSTPLEFRFPDNVPSRDAEVFINGMPASVISPIGVAINGLRVPQPALLHHLALRALAGSTTGSAPMLIPALAETGPIDILRGQPVVRRLTRLPEPPPLPPRGFVPIDSQRLPPDSRIVAFEKK
jgi:hypothetical protein